MTARNRAGMAALSHHQSQELRCHLPCASATKPSQPSRPCREALDQVRGIVRDNADTQPEVLDVDTGQPVAPDASQGSRDRLASKIGF